MHLTPAMVDDLMAIEGIEPLAAHDLLQGVQRRLLVPAVHQQPRVPDPPTGPLESGGAVRDRAVHAALPEQSAAVLAPYLC